MKESCPKGRHSSPNIASSKLPPPPASSCRFVFLFPLFSLLFLSFSTPSSAIGSSMVLGIDMGSQYIKVAYAATGGRLEILLNERSRRKTFDAMTFEPVDFDDLTRFSRNFGEEAISSLEKPKRRSFLYPTDILGRGPDLEEAGESEEQHTTRKNPAAESSSSDAFQRDSSFPGYITRPYSENPDSKDSSSPADDSSPTHNPKIPQKQPKFGKDHIFGVNFAHEFFPLEYKVDEDRGTWFFKVSNDDYMHSEEIIAQLLSYIKQFALKAAGLPANYPTPIGCVIAIPCSVTQRQRLAIVYSAELAGLDVYGLTHSLVTAGLQFYLDKGSRENAVQRILLFDVGASMVNAGVIEITGESFSFHSDGKSSGNSGESSSNGGKTVPAENSSAEAPNEKGSSSEKSSAGAEGEEAVKNGSSKDSRKDGEASGKKKENAASSSKNKGKKKIPASVKLLSCVSTPAGGGREVDEAIARHMVESIRAQYPQSYPLQPHTMSSVFLTAGRVKEKLSSSSVAPYKIQGVLRHTDFSGTLERAKLDSLIAGETRVLEGLRYAFDEAISRSGYPTSSIDAFELLGGGWRYPPILEHIRSFVTDGRRDFGMRLNSEEATAMGAAFVAASLSATMKALDITIVDSVAYHVSVRFLRLVPSTGVETQNSNASAEEGKDQAGDSSREQRADASSTANEDTSKGESFDTHEPSASHTTKATPLPTFEIFKVIDLVHAGAPLQGNKKARFSTESDVILQIFEDGDIISEYETIGISNTVKNPAYADYLTPKFSVKLSFSKSGIVEFQGASLTFELDPVKYPKASKTATENESSSPSSASKAEKKLDESSTESGSTHPEAFKDDTLSDSSPGTASDGAEASHSKESAPKQAEKAEDPTKNPPSSSSGDGGVRDAQSEESDEKKVTSSPSPSSENSTTANSADKSPPRKVTLPLTLKHRFYRPKPLLAKDLKTSEKKIEKYAVHDEGALRLSFLHDKLERFIYKTKDLLRSSKNHIFCSSDSKRQELMQKLEDYEEFLYDATAKSESSNPEKISEILSNLKLEMEPIQSKVDEVLTRMEIFNSMNVFLSGAADNVKQLHMKVPWAIDQIQTLEEEVLELRGWWESASHGGVAWETCLAHEWRWSIDEGKGKVFDLMSKFTQVENTKRPEGWGVPKKNAGGGEGEGTGVGSEGNAGKDAAVGSEGNAGESAGVGGKSDAGEEAAEGGARKEANMGGEGEMRSEHGKQKANFSDEL